MILAGTDSRAARVTWMVRNPPASSADSIQGWSLSLAARAAPPSGRVNGSVVM
jgi:hypothetical protein